MSQELLYTSAPKGLKSGAHGFCMVLCSEGMPAPLATALEGLSAYKPVYPVGDPDQDRNPVTAMHVILPAIGRKQHVLSRVASYGLDYSGRPNKLAHHVVLDARDMAAAGPAWLLAQPGVMKKEWSGEPKVVAANRRLPAGDAPPGPCRAWARATGDAGWAGVLAESLMKDPARLAYLIIEPGLDVLPLFAEAIALLPPDRRWQATFSTYFTTLPAGATCNWRCLLADSPLVHQSKRHVHALRLDLTGPLGKAPDGEWVEYARTGNRPRVVEAGLTESAKPSLSNVDVDDDAYQLVGLEASSRALSRPPRRRRDHQSKGKNLLLVTGSLTLVTGIVAGLILWISRRPSHNADLATTHVRASNVPPASEPAIPQAPLAEQGKTVDSSTIDNATADQAHTPIISEPQSETNAQSTKSAAAKADVVASGPPAGSVPVPPMPTTTVQWSSFAGSQIPVRVSSPILQDDAASIRFLAPKHLLKELRQVTQLGGSPLRVTVSSEGKTLDASERTDWYTVKFAESDTLEIAPDNENRIAKLDGCALLVTSKLGDTCILPLTPRTASDKLLHKVKPWLFASGANKSLSVALPFADKTPLPAFDLKGLKIRLGDAEVLFDRRAIKIGADSDEAKRQVIGNQPVVLQPINFEQVIAKLFVNEMVRSSRSDDLPSLTVSVASPGSKSDSRSLSIALKAPDDLGGFLVSLNDQLRGDLGILARNEVPTSDPPRAEPGKGNRRDASQASPPLMLKPINVWGAGREITDLKVMEEQLDRWTQQASDRHKELSSFTNIQADAFRNHVAEVETCQSRLERYSALVKEAIQIRDNLKNAQLIAGSVTYSAFDPNDSGFKAEIPVFEVVSP